MSINTADVPLLPAGARAFLLVLLATPVALSDDAQSMLSAILLAVVWLGGTLADTLRRLPSRSVIAVETCLTTFLAAWALPDASVLLPALILPPLVSGLHRRVKGVIEALLVQVVILGATLLPNNTVSAWQPLTLVLFTWLMIGLGIGLMASILSRVRESVRPQGTSYGDARRLIKQLLDLSGELTAGLDPVGIAEQVIDLTREEIPLLALSIHVVDDISGTRVLTGDANADHAEQRAAVVRAVLLSRQPSKSGRDVAFPLTTDAGVIGVVSGTLPPGRGVTSRALESALSDLVDLLRPVALQLDTALLFAQVQAEATEEERRRLARELHDGVAQDLASLGYLIDDLAAGSADVEVVERAKGLRTELSQVVAELRCSITGLRSAASSQGTLAHRIASVARHLRARSGVELVVDIEEGPGRMPPDQEAELLRIVQEAVTNAMRHARASHVTVTGIVSADECVVSIVDNGVGLQRGRKDSHGLRIMRERARRVGGVLEITSPRTGKGTEVRLTTGASRANTERVIPEGAGRVHYRAQS